MDVISTCPLRVASLAWQPLPGAFAVAFVCKATYGLAPGTSLLAPVQDEPWLRDDYWNDDERGSLVRASDLVPFKRHADVILVGHAYAPEGRAVGSLLARLVAGEVDKTIAVHGDRGLGSDDHVGVPVPFVRAPLRWERAAGGPGTVNPAGMAADAAGGKVPSLLPPELHVVSRRSASPPVGFMPVAPWWPGRMDKLRHRAAGWDHRRWSERALPDDIDAAYFNVAPPDQQVREIRADERLVLENLHPDHPRLVTNLAAISPRAVAEVGGAPPQEVRLRCDTLWIDTDRGTASLVWRGNVRLAHPARAGRVVVSMEPLRPPPVTTEVSAPAGVLGLAAVHAKFGGTAGLDPAMVRRAALPFGAADHVAGPPATSAPPAPAPPPGGSGDSRAERAAVHAKFGGTTVLDPAMVRRAATPFRPNDAAPSPAVSPPVWVNPTPPVPDPIADHGTVAPVDARAERAPDPPPPPLIGPLATPEMVAVAEPPPPAQQPAAPVEPAASVEPAAPAEPVLPLDVYPAPRCAAIAASIARRKTEKGAVLERHDLTADAWTALDAHWAEAVQKDLARGKTALLSAYDAAYVAQLEAERGDITVEEYARLVVSAERGTEQETLAELGLPRGAMLRVQRVWLKRIAKSAALGKRVREAVGEVGQK